MKSLFPKIWFGNNHKEEALQSKSEVIQPSLPIIQPIVDDSQIFCNDNHKFCLLCGEPLTSVVEQQRSSLYINFTYFYCKKCVFYKDRLKKIHAKHNKMKSCFDYVVKINDIGEKFVHKQWVFSLEPEGICLAQIRTKAYLTFNFYFYNNPSQYHCLKIDDQRTNEFLVDPQNKQEMWYLNKYLSKIYKLRMFA